MSPDDTLLFHQQAMSFLERELSKPFEGGTVIVSHHLPSYKSLEEQYLGDSLSPAYASELDEFVKKSRVSLWLHGHAHTSSDYKIGKTRVLCNPRGYPPEQLNPEFKDNLVIDV